MYSHNQRQLLIKEDELVFSGIKLNPENRWVKLAEIIPWDEIEEEYVKNFQQIRRGGEARSARFALGTLIIKEQLNLSDRETIVVPKSRTKKTRKRDKVKSQRLRHDSYISNGVIFPGRDICGRSSL